MLSDSLFDVYQHLKEKYIHYKEPPFNYRKEIFLEVEDILERIDTLRGKLDAEFDYRGPMCFDDDGAWQQYKQAIYKFRSDVFELAGDLSNEVEDENQVYWTEASLQWSLALQKLKREGKIELYYELHRKYFGSEA